MRYPLHWWSIPGYHLFAHEEPKKIGGEMLGTLREKTRVVFMSPMVTCSPSSGDFWKDFPFFARVGLRPTTK